MLCVGTKEGDEPLSYLRDLIDEYREHSADPKEVAPLVLQRIVSDIGHDCKAVEALREALPEHVRQVMKRPPSIDSTVKQYPKTQGTPWHMTETGRRLRQSHDNGRGVWKRLGDWTYEDMLSYAEALRLDAQQLVTKADILETFAYEMRDKGVDTLREMPEDFILTVTDVM